MEINRFMRIFLLPLLGGFISCSHGCSFPSFMTKARKPWLRKAVTSPGLALNKTYISYHEWNFEKDGIVEVSEIHPQRTNEGIKVSIKTYTCVQVFSDSLFMVVDSAIGETTKTLCIKFVQRSFYVAQIAFSEEYSTNFEVLDCATEKLYTSPLILLYYHEHILSEVPLNDYIEKCPIVGGFDMKIYTEDGGLFCASHPPIRLESDCSPGAGLVFRSYMNECSLGESLVQKFYCIASWKEGDYQFIVARPQYFFTGNTAVLTIRLQTSTSVGKYKAIVSTDLLCNNAIPGSYKESFFEAVLRRFVIEDPCSDITPECTRIDPRSCTRHQQETCSSTCSFCSVHRVWETFSLPVDLQGKWLRQTFEGGKEILSINRGTIKIPSFGDIQIMGKSECKRTWITESQYDYLGIISFQNGCAPKIVGVMISRQTGAVISMRISQPTSIPINKFGYDFLFLWQYWCTHVQYGLDSDNPSLRDRYWTAKDGWANLVAVGTSISEASDCNLPEHLHHARIMIKERSGKDHYFCDSALHITGNYSFIIDRNLCKFEDNSSFSVRSQHYSCLSSFVDKNNLKYLIVRVGSYQGVATNFRCWIFGTVNTTLSDSEEILAFPAGNCDPVALTRADHLPLAVITRLGSLPPPTVPAPTREAVKLVNSSPCHQYNQHFIFTIIMCSFAELMVQKL